MFLALDVGNSHAVLGVFDPQPSDPPVLVSSFRMATQAECTPDELRLKIDLFLQNGGQSLSDFEALVVSSVVPKFTRLLQQAFPGDFLRLIDRSWSYSFRIGPDSIGVDRLVNAEAALREYGAPCLILDSGTASTLCALSVEDDGPLLRGGAIFPGLNMMLRSLTEGTALLRDIDLRTPAQVIGTNTAEALQSGLLFGLSALIDGLVQRFKAELKVQELPVLVTGGAGALLRSLAKELTHYDSKLTLKGIAYLYETHTQR